MPNAAPGIALTLAFAVSIDGLGMSLPPEAVVVTVCRPPFDLTIPADQSVGRIVLSRLAVIFGFTSPLTIDSATDALLWTKWGGNKKLMAIGTMQRRVHGKTPESACRTSIGFLFPHRLAEQATDRI